MPFDASLAEALRAYNHAAGIGEDRKSFRFRTAKGLHLVGLTEQSMPQLDT